MGQALSCSPWVARTEHRKEDEAAGETSFQLQVPLLLSSA